MRAVSYGEHDVDITRASAARAAYRSTNVNAAREQIILLAAAPVVRAADKVFASLRLLRDVAGQGSGQDSPDYQQVLTEYQGALKYLRNVMREDLGTPSLTDDPYL